MFNKMAQDVELVLQLKLIATSSIKKGVYIDVAFVLTYLLLLLKFS